MPTYQVNYSHRKASFNEFLLLVLKACAEMGWHITYISENKLNAHTSADFIGSPGSNEVVVEKVTEQLVSIQSHQNSTGILPFGKSRKLVNDLIEKVVEIASRPGPVQTGSGINNDSG
jgi:hypothetical protein